MDFIQLPDGTWYEADYDSNRLYNLRGGHLPLKKTDIEKYNQISCQDWHKLYMLTGFNPLKDDRLWHTGWISPEGDFYPCEAHEVDAEYIYQLIYGDDYAAYGDRLVQKGWLKVTNSLMFDIYTRNGHYDKIASKEQGNTLNKWIKKYILREPVKYE